MKIHDSCIYQIKNNINGKCYIGQTVNFQNRKNAHLSALRRGVSDNKHLQAAFNKYGEDAFAFSIIEICPKDRLNEREEYWIIKHDTCHTGYNMNKGGGGRHGFHHAEETKKKISEATKGKKVSDATRRRMSENHADFSGEKNPFYGIKWSDRFSPEQQMEIKNKMSKSQSGENNHNFGKTMSEEQKKKLSHSIKMWYATHENPQKGKKRPNLSGGLSPMAHKVMCLNTQKVYDTMKVAAESCGVSASGISLCCSNEAQYAGRDENGFPLFWIDYESVSNLSESELCNILQERIDNLNNRDSRPKKAIRCITTGEIFPRMKDACDKYHIDPSSLSGHCNKRKCLNGCGRHPITRELLQWERI